MTTETTTTVRPSLTGEGATRRQQSLPWTRCCPRSGRGERTAAVLEAYKLSVSYRFGDKNRHEIDAVAAETLSLDPEAESQQQLLDD